MWEGNTQDGGEVWNWEAAGKGEAPLSRRSLYPGLSQGKPSGRPDTCFEPALRATL